MYSSWPWVTLLYLSWLGLGKEVYGYGWGAVYMQAAGADGGDAAVTWCCVAPVFGNVLCRAELLALVLFRRAWRMCMFLPFVPARSNFSLPAWIFCKGREVQAFVFASGVLDFHFSFVLVFQLVIFKIFSGWFLYNRRRIASVHLCAPVCLCVCLCWWKCDIWRTSEWVKVTEKSLHEWMNEWRRWCTTIRLV